MTDQLAAPAEQVAVTIDSCCKEDAQAVLAALQASFASDRARGDTPADAPNGRPIVWAATFDVSRTLGSPAPARLTEPVGITAQGGYHAVDRLREGLSGAFAVRVVGTASGDQEEEVRFRLENR
ncbi:hypothetical protein [Actinacidiphila acididurans]|uniref:hypothetical protein n=1 Tax=Actinacidiphila acididurans TaxID=2784346 RepID=UPI0027DC7D2F|nr:hypothetical protein [Actinacidiphila acididurans]